MGWNDLMAGAAGTITAAFGQSALTEDRQLLRVILDIIPQTIGTAYEPVTENHPVIILLRSAIPDGLDTGIQLTLENEEIYEIERIAQERTDRHHIAYWVKRIEE